MKKLRCIIIGSSMTMPSVGLKYEETWHYKLINKYNDVEFIDKNVRSSSVRRLITEGALTKGEDLLENYSPNFVIMQIGISDCSPRLLKREATLTRIINKLPFSNFIYNIVRKTKGRTISCADLDTKTFYDCLSKYADRALKNNVHVFCVKIAHTGPSVVKKSPHMNEAIDLYNKEFDKLANNYSNVTTIFSYPEDIDIQSITIKDEIHPNIRGSEIIFSNIDNTIASFIESKLHNMDKK